MNHLVPPHTTRRPACQVARTLTVCVIDRNAEDYEGWQATAKDRGLRLKFVATAEEALRLVHTAAVDLWVINTELPGLSGCELCEMLRSCSTIVPIALIAATHSAELERGASRIRATLFGVKPGHTRWLHEWGHASQPSARRLAHRVNSFGNPK